MGKPWKRGVLRWPGGRKPGHKEAAGSGMLTRKPWVPMKTLSEPKQGEITLGEPTLDSENVTPRLTDPDLSGAV